MGRIWNGIDGWIWMERDGKGQREMRKLGRYIPGVFVLLLSTNLLLQTSIYTRHCESVVGLGRGDGEQARETQSRGSFFCCCLVDTDELQSLGFPRYFHLMYYIYTARQRRRRRRREITNITDLSYYYSCCLCSLFSCFEKIWKRHPVVFCISYK